MKKNYNLECCRGRKKWKRIDKDWIERPKCELSWKLIETWVIAKAAIVSQKLGYLGQNFINVKMLRQIRQTYALPQILYMFILFMVKTALWKIILFETAYDSIQNYWKSLDSFK